MYFLHMGHYAHYVYVTDRARYTHGIVRQKSLLDLVKYRSATYLW